MNGQEKPEWSQISKIIDWTDNYEHTTDDKVFSFKKGLIATQILNNKMVNAHNCSRINVETDGK